MPPANQSTGPYLNLFKCYSRHRGRVSTRRRNGDSHFAVLVHNISHFSFIVPEWISYKDTVNTCEWNFTLNGNTEDCITIADDPGDSGRVPFFLSLYSGAVKRFSFADIMRFKITFTVDPEGKLPNGKGDVPSMIVAYPTCVPAHWGSNEICGPFKGIHYGWVKKIRNK